MLHKNSPFRLPYAEMYTGKALCDYSIGNTGTEVKKCIMIVRILQEVSQKRYCLHRGHFRRTRFRRDVL